MDTATQAARPPCHQHACRFNPPSLRFAKRAARDLQRAFYTHEGVGLRLSMAQEALARMYGYQDWFSLDAAIKRDGYSPSVLDNDAGPEIVKARRRAHAAVMESFLNIGLGTALLIAADARLTISPSADHLHFDERIYLDNPRQPLPQAAPRPGLSEILMTACPYSPDTPNIPLPGWTHYIVVAAPLDNTALWVRFCDAHSVGDAAANLVRAIRELSQGALKSAYVASMVIDEFPDIAIRLAECDVAVQGGRTAILAARLRARLDSVLVLTGMSSRLKDDQAPTHAELAELMHSAPGLIEIPDRKGLGSYEMDLRWMSFSNAVICKIRELRWNKGERPDVDAHDNSPPPNADRQAFNESGMSLEGGVTPIPKGSPVYRLRISLDLSAVWLEPPRHVSITRTIDVPVYYDLWALHVAIQDAMGWADYHLHEFTFYAGRSGPRTVSFCSPNDDDPDAPTSANERLYKHAAVLAERGGRYRYDFGDGWDHSLWLLAAVPSDGGGYPRCISGERACPPEDCGSTEGYFRVVDTLKAGPRKRDVDSDYSYKELKEWLSNHSNTTWPYRPDHFDPKAVAFDDPQSRWDYAYGSGAS